MRGRMWAGSMRRMCSRSGWGCMLMRLSGCCKAGSRIGAIARRSCCGSGGMRRARARGAGAIWVAGI